MNTRFLAGLIAGIFLVVLFGSPKAEHPHHHANFALYVNGVQDTFDSFTFYEEVASCTADAENNPKHRAHMHDQKNHVIHVHDNGVTWGHFLANLGYGLTSQTLATEGNWINNSSGKQLRFILNGNEEYDIYNRVIGSEDVLLINYGDEGYDTLLSRYNSIPRNAREFNTRSDPAACAGN